MKDKFFDPTMIRFLMVGVVNTFVGTGTMFVLYNWVNCSYWVSSAGNYFVGGIVSFFLNKFFTFKNTDHSWQQVFKFAFTVVVCYLIGYGVSKSFIMWLLNSYTVRVQENIAMFIGMCFYVILNYFIQRFFVFKNKMS